MNGECFNNDISSDSRQSALLYSAPLSPFSISSYSPIHIIDLGHDYCTNFLKHLFNSIFSQLATQFESKTITNKFTIRNYIQNLNFQLFDEKSISGSQFE